MCKLLFSFGVCVGIIALVAMIVFITLQEPAPKVLNCSGAPAQYKQAETWLDEGGSYRCAKEGEKGAEHYLFYADGQIN